MHSLLESFIGGKKTLITVIVITVEPLKVARSAYDRKPRKKYKINQRYLFGAVSRLTRKLNLMKPCATGASQ